MSEKNSGHSDFLGRELAIGDIIATTNGGHSDQSLFRVVSFTPKKIRLGKLLKDKANPGSYIDEFTARGYSLLKENYQVCLIQKFDKMPVPATNINF